MPIPRFFREFRTVRTLLSTAERIARAGGDEHPGAEHLLLAAFELPDGTARRAFDELGVRPEDLPAAIADQHADALASVGVTAPGSQAAASPLPEPSGVYRSQPSAQAVFQRAVEISGTPPPRHLRGAHILLAVSELEHGTASRALRRLGIDPDRLRTAAERALAGARAG
jgi:ATP-dependent Clp protease ATP-binding subunit ClpA